MDRNQLILYVAYALILSVFLYIEPLFTAGVIFICAGIVVIQRARRP